MSLPKIIVSFTRDDYDAIKRLASDDPDLPDTYDEWLDLQTVEITKLESQGIAFKKVIIDSDGLAAHCQASGVNHDSVGRYTYAVFVGRLGQYPGTKPT